MGNHHTAWTSYATVEMFAEERNIAVVMLAAENSGYINQGVQSPPGIGATIKHFVCNNLEDNRKHSNSIVSQRALREIYLKGFELAVKASQPMALMTSYNLINGVHTANQPDLLHTVLRDEWGYAGLVVTDWTTTGEGGSSPVECMRAGNDLIMPGSFSDLQQIKEALALKGEGALDWADVKKCITRLVNLVWQSLEYEDAKPYSSQFSRFPRIMQARQIGKPEGER